MSLPWVDSRALLRHRAAYDGDGEGVNLALRNGIKVDAPDEIGNTALIIAVMRG